MVPASRRRPRRRRWWWGRRGSGRRRGRPRGGRRTGGPCRWGACRKAPSGSASPPSSPSEDWPCRWWWGGPPPHRRRSFYPSRRRRLRHQEAEMDGCCWWWRWLGNKKGREVKGAGDWDAEADEASPLTDVNRKRERLAFAFLLFAWFLFWLLGPARFGGVWTLGFRFGLVMDPHYVWQLSSLQGRELKMIFFIPQ